MERSRFRHFEEIHSRWEDQDCYRHINNVVAYSFFDTAVNRHMMQAAGFSIHDPHVGFVVSSSCDYFKPLSFPSLVSVGIAIPRGSLGTSSVKYQLALFSGDDSSASAQGSFTQVFVDAATQKPAPIPDRVRSCLEALLVPP